VCFVFVFVCHIISRGKCVKKSTAKQWAATFPVCRFAPRKPAGISCQLIYSLFFSLFFFSIFYFVCCFWRRLAESFKINLRHKNFKSFAKARRTKNKICVNFEGNEERNGAKRTGMERKGRARGREPSKLRNICFLCPTFVALKVVLINVDTHENNYKRSRKNHSENSC